MGADSVLSADGVREQDARQSACRKGLGWNVWNDPRENVVEEAGRILCYGMTEVQS